MIIDIHGHYTTAPQALQDFRDAQLVALADPTRPVPEIAQISDDARERRADEFGVRQVELYHNASGQVYCLLEAPDEEAVRKHHAALGIDCGAVHRVHGIA